MNNWFKVALFGAASLMSVATMAAEKPIRIAIEGAYRPFNWTDPDGSLQGFDVEIAKALCEQMQRECTLVKQEWDGMIPALLSRKFDAIISTMDITEERKKRVDFSEKYQQIPARFVAAKGAEFDSTDAFFAGKNVGVQKSTTMDTYIVDNFPSANLKRYDDYNQAYLDLKAGRVDFVMADSAAIYDGLLSQEGGDAFDFVGPNYTDSRWFGEGAGVVVRKQDSALRDEFSAAIKAIRESGKYKEIQDKFFNFDVYGE